MTQPVVSTPAAAGTGLTAQPTRADLKQAARQFEAIFLRQMIGSMRQANLGDDLFGSDAANQFRDMQDQRTAETMAATTPSGEDKRDLALGVAEVFAYLARMRGDSVALVAGDAGRMTSRPARSGAKHVETLLALLARTFEDLDAPVEGRPASTSWPPGHLPPACRASWSG